MTTLRNQLIDAFANRRAKRGVDREAVVAYVHQSGTCDHGRLIWRRCGECESDGLSDDEVARIVAFTNVVSRVTDAKPGPLERADVAALRGVTVETLRTQQRAYPPGSASEFPQPNGHIGRAPYWNADRALELASWDGVGQGVGGGRRHKADTPPATPAN